MEEKDIKLYKDIFYYINGDAKTPTVIGFKNGTKVAEVPNIIEDMKVTRMTAEFPTYGYTSLKEITISSGITLEKQLFALNHSIEKVFLEAGVTLCGQVFEYSDLKEIKMEKGVKINDIPALFRVERNKKDYGNFLFNSYPISKNPNAPRAWKECFEENLSSSNYKKKDIFLLKKKVITYIDSLQKISKNNYSNEEMILKEIKELVDYINEFNKKFHAIETEDREEICEIIDRCAILAGYPYPDPQIQSDFDITYKWREW